uniref:Mucin n=1 Tax=Solanum tuberosum TaxID=4113 RepID=M1AAI3_SOLTU
MVSYFITPICIVVGFDRLISSNSNSDHPLPDEVIFVLLYGMCLVFLISYAYAIIIRPSLDNGLRYMPTIPPDVMTDMPWWEQVSRRIVYVIVGPPPDRIAGFITQFVVTLNNIRMTFLLIALLCSGIGLDPVITYLLVKERFSRWGTCPPFIRKIMKFSLGLVGIILFQYFFRSPSTHQLVGFLFVTIAWLGNLAMVKPSTDLGIFNFLLVNACLSCAVDHFNLGIRTWLVFAACILLYFLREKLDSVTLSYDRRYRPEQDQLLSQIPPSLPSSIDDVDVVPNSSSATLTHQPTLEGTSTNSLEFSISYSPEQDQLLSQIPPSLPSSIDDVDVVPNSSSGTLTRQTTLEQSSTNSPCTTLIHQPTLEGTSTNSPSTTLTRQPTLVRSSTNSPSGTLTLQTTLKRSSTNSPSTTLTHQPTLEQSSTNSPATTLTRQPTLVRSSTNSPSGILTCQPTLERSSTI